MDRAHCWPLDGLAQGGEPGRRATEQLEQQGGRCAGEAFVDFVTRELLEPLGMRRTGFAHATIPTDIATGYWRVVPSGETAMRLLLPARLVDRRVDRLVGFRPFYVNGPSYGGLVGDVSDAARFIALHLHDGAVGDRQLLSGDSARAMRRLRTDGKKLTTAVPQVGRSTGQPVRSYVAAPRARSCRRCSR